MQQPKKKHFRVRFQTKDDAKCLEVVVGQVYSSEFMGLITLDGFIFEDQKKQVILPTEDEARKRFHEVDRLHIPYHNILSVEEYEPKEADLKNLPFLRHTQQESDTL